MFGQGRQPGGVIRAKISLRFPLSPSLQSQKGGGMDQPSLKCAITLCQAKLLECINAFNSLNDPDSQVLVVVIFPLGRQPAERQREST